MKETVTADISGMKPTSKRVTPLLRKVFVMSYKAVAVPPAWEEGVPRLATDFFAHLRVYCSRSVETFYAVLTIIMTHACGSGVGQASGWGYDKASEAFADAIQDAGITLQKDDGRAFDIGGSGDEAMLAAFDAISRAAAQADDVPNWLIVKREA